MASSDTCCTLAPYFEVQPGKLAEFKGLCDEFVAATRTEPKCVHYAFSFDGDAVHCREGYDDAEGLLAHLKHVGPILDKAFRIARITRLEVHAPPAEIDKLRGPLAGLKPQFFEVECGFRR